MTRLTKRESALLATIQGDEALLATIQGDERISAVWFEGLGDGWFADCVSGYNLEGCMSIRGNTLQQLADKLAFIIPGPWYFERRK